MTDMDPTRERTELRAQDPAYREISVDVSRPALRRLERAFQAFFRRVTREADPRGMSRRCSQCGMTPAKELSPRAHRYRAWGLVIGRDRNAARNIPALGRSAAAVVGHSSN